jgi:hypothetical protein
MDRRLIFRHPLSKGEQIGDAAITWIGVIDTSVPQGRQHLNWNFNGMLFAELTPCALS